MGIFDIKTQIFSARTMTLQTHGLSITFLMNVQRTKTESHLMNLMKIIFGII